MHVAFGESFLPSEAAAWTFNLLSPGRYHLSATWYTNPFFSDLWSTAARFEVSDGSTVLDTVRLNTQSPPNEFSDAGSDWESLGEFEITGTTLRVRLLTALDDRYVIADAIRVERIGSLSADTEVHVTMAGETGLNIADGIGNADFGATDFNEPVQRTFTISNHGTAPLILTLPITVTGSAFSVVQQPADTNLAAGESTTFIIQMNGNRSCTSRYVPT